MPKTWRYLAYGSNLNLGQMGARCPSAWPLDAVNLRGWELQFRDVATITRKPGAVTPAAVYRVTGACIKALDRAEGVNWRYKRQWIDVKGFGPCLAYVMMSGEPAEAPSERYLAKIRHGYFEWELDDSFLDAAVARAPKRRSLLATSREIERWALQEGWDLPYAEGVTLSDQDWLTAANRGAFTVNTRQPQGQNTRWVTNGAGQTRWLQYAEDNMSRQKEQNRR